MESGPPLNLSTSIKVEDSVLNSIGEGAKEELIQHPDGNQSFVLLQPLTNNENEVLTITGEPVKEDEILSSKKNDELEEEDKIKNYTCSHCSEKFYRASQLRSHEKRHINEKSHYCEQCLETFPRLSLLLRHKQEHAKKTYECSECSLSLSNYNGFRMHMKRHMKRFKCPECSMTFIQQSHMITHTRKHTGEKPYVCHICNNRFKQVSHLTTHLRTHTKDRPYVCEFCNASFSQTGSLKRHRRSHTGEKPYQCKKCDSVFVEKRNLNRHLLSHSGIRPFKCDMCSASFTQFIDLKRHTFSHSGYKPFKCNVCEAAFSRKNNLKWHKLTHEGDTPHICDVCNAGFRIGRDLKTHKKCHVENKPYSCEYCKATFLQLSTLKRHVNVHTGNRPFSCDICKATFFEKSSLKRHIQRHQANKPFPCEHCVSSFYDARTLKRHKIVVHKEGNYADGEIIKSEGIPSKVVGSKEISQALEEENSLHIYEPSFQKVPLATESNVIPSTNPDMSKPSSELTIQTHPVSHMLSESNADNVTSIPTLVLSQPGQPPKTARPADNCQNHHSHVHTLLEGSYGQWQTWCFCDTPNIPLSTDPMNTTVPGQPLNVQGLNYEGAPHSLPNSVQDTSQTIQTNLTQSHDCQEQSIPGERVSSQEEAQSVSQTVFHTVNSAQSSELQPVNVSYADYNEQIDSYNESLSVERTEQPSSELTDVSVQHQLNSTTFRARESAVIIGKNGYVATASDNLDPSCHFHKEKKCPDEEIEEKVNVSDSLARLNKDDIQENPEEGLRLNCSDTEIIIPCVTPKITSKKLFTNTQDDSSGVISQVISVSEEQFQAAERQDAYNDKTQTPEVKQSPVNKTKDSNENQASSDTPSIALSPQNVMLNSSNIKDTSAAPLYPLCEDLPQTISADRKQQVTTMQYSLTINNPATGEIQIQSDMFPAKPEETSPKRPVKKLRFLRYDWLREKFLCSLCPKKFAKKHQLELHLRKHAGEKPFTCGICNQCFSHNNSLIIHMRSHTGERPYVCIYCGATFTQKSNLGVHHRVHTGEKPFKCDVCDSAFSQGSHLIAHKRIHNNDRPFVCSTCGQAFTQRSALKRHEMKHSGLKPHSCNVCEAKFSQKDDLKRHSVLHINGSPKGKDKTNVTGKSLKAVYKRYGVKSNIKKTSLTNDEKKEEAVKESEHDASNDNVNNSQVSLEKKMDETTENPSIETKTEKKKHAIKSVKTKIKEMVEPVRTSKRIKEAAEKKKNKTENSDFITGDLEEIDQVEEMENQLVKVTRTGGWKKKDGQKTDSGEVVQSWCFCEVPHGPNEPHTHAEVNTKITQNESEVSSVVAQIQQEVPSGVLVNNENCREGILQFTIPQLQHAVVLQSDQVALHSQQNAPVNSGPISLTSENLVVSTSGVPESQVLNNTLNATEASSLGNQFLSAPDHIVASQDGHHVSTIQEDGKAVYGTAQIIPGQVIPAGHFVSSADGTFFFEAGDIINNGAVVLNSSPGTFIFDLCGEGQLLNVPIGANVGQESLIVTGSSSLDGNVSTSASQANFSSSVEPSSTGTISFSVRDSQTGTLLENATPHPTTVLTSSDVTSQNILASDNSVIVNTATGSGTATISEPDSSHYIDSSNISLFNTNIPIQSDEAELGEIGTKNASAARSGKAGSVYMSSSQTETIIVNPSKCSVCGKEFAGKKTLKQHMRMVHPGLHFCPTCFDAFTTKEHLMTHKLQHKTAHPCPECLIPCVSASSLNSHRQKVHKVTGLSSRKGMRNFACNRCKASFFQMSDLNRHLLGHTGEKPFKCVHCAACFTRKSSLNKHERIHTGEKPYICKECGVSFAYRYQINRHRTLHKDDQGIFSMPYVGN